MVLERKTTEKRIFLNWKRMSVFYGTFVECWKENQGDRIFYCLKVYPH
jgi:hypothetical protein